MKNKIGCLVIHGFAGNIEEVKPVADYLNELGYKSLCVELKGHNGNRKDLAKYGYLDWIKSAEECYEKLSEECDSIIVVGFSMGGLISVNLSLNHSINAIALVNTPVYFWDFKRIILNLVEDIRCMRIKSLKRYATSCTDKPLPTMINFLKLLWKTKSCFERVNCPVFIGQGLLDDTVQPRSAEYIKNNVKAEKMLKYYKNSDHQIFKGIDRNEVVRDIVEFISRIEKQ